MKAFIQFFGALFLTTMLFACQEKGTTINGTVSNAASMQVKLEKVKLNSSAITLGTTEADANGKFSINLPEGASEGLYRITIGNQSAGLVFDGTEKKVNIEGDISTLRTQAFSIEGSPSTMELNNTMTDYYARKLTPQDITEKAKSYENPLVGMQMALSVLGPRPEYAPLYTTINQQIKTKFPESDYVAEFDKVIAQLKTSKQRSAPQEKLSVGNPAPDIALKSPDGKTYALSDLKGKVVLVDFWASWCGPCRKANPHVVELYHKYKNKGFTVYSVSLDGVDERTKRRFSSAEQIEQQMIRSKQRWLAAIEKDKLEWDYHVSDLKKWDCAPAKEYGVRSIPRTFLIDKEGKIAAINPRYNLEEELKKLL